MKKLMLLALSFAVSSLLYAHGSYGPNNSYDGNSEGWQEMNEIHEVMHNTSIKGDKTERGVVFEITATEESAIASVKKLFADEPEKLDSYFSNVDVTVESLENGVRVNLEADDENTIKSLQAYGVSPIYRYLHNSVFNGQSGMGYGHGMMHGYGDGMGNGSGMMNGYGNGMGNDSGMMNGYGNGMGNGPGMMYNNGSDSQDNLRPGAMRWNAGYRGNGSGMM